MLESWRLTLAHKGGGFVAQTVERLNGRTAGGNWIDPDEFKTQRQPVRPTVGRFIELRDADGRTIYKRDITESAPDTLEYPTGNADSPFGRMPMPEGKLVFIRVPGHGRAKSAVILEATVRKGRKAKDTEPEESSDIVSKVLVEVELRATTSRQEESR
jgi:hypothetical protein